jgi:CubicO group peptidase (beta-lactamase class C family)
MTEGLTPSGIDGLRAAAQRAVDAGEVPGLVALVARGPHVQIETIGTLAVDGRPVARDSIFRIASITKPVTAAATLAVVAEGLIGLDEPVDRLLPELAGRRVLRRMDGPLHVRDFGCSTGASRHARRGLRGVGVGASRR